MGTPIAGSDLCLGFREGRTFEANLARLASLRRELANLAGTADPRRARVLSTIEQIEAKQRFFAAKYGQHAE